MCRWLDSVFAAEESVLFLLPVKFPALGQHRRVCAMMGKFGVLAGMLQVVGNL